MIRDYTDFINNAVGIDPAGCGCTDCVIGNSVPLDDIGQLGLLARQAVSGRPLVNRSSEPLALRIDEPTIFAVPEGFPDRWRFSPEEVTVLPFGKR